jgi:predicted HAD superfamily Cof-like phosphohydrolase
MSLGQKYSARYALTPAMKRVRGFHRKMDQPIGDVTEPKVAAVALRLRLIAEEFDEILGALSGKPVNFVSNAVSEWAADEPFVAEPNMAQVSQELADLCYVTLGAAVIWGVPLGEVFEEVCDANDRKVGGPVREDGKRLKPPGWTPPDVAGVLHRIATGPCRHFKTEPYDCACYNGCQTCKYNRKCLDCEALITGR